MSNNCIPLKFDEYLCLRNLFGALGVMDRAKERMTDRLKNAVPDGESRMSDIIQQYEKLLCDIVITTPADRRQALERELHHMHIQVKCTKPKLNPADGITYVHQKPLERVIDHALDMDCFACDKCGRDVLECQLRKDIQMLYHYDFPKEWRNGCPLAQHVSIKDFEMEEK